MRLTSLRALFDYGAWANACVWDTAADLNDAQLDRAFEMGEGSLRKTLAHIYGAERVWGERCDVPGAEGLPRSRDTHTLADIRDAAQRLGELRNGWLDALADGELTREITYTKETHTYTHALGDVLLHVCNHGIHHRAQALNILRRLGKEVPTLDVLIMRIRQQAQPAMKTDLGTLHSYYEYTDWANSRVFDIANTLSNDQLRREFEMGMGCILKTLAHLHDAEQWWLENWRSGPVTDFRQIEPDTTAGELRDAYQETIDNRNAYFDRLNENDLDGTVTATPKEGQTRTFTLGESMLQLCGHGTHHRAQIANMFRHVDTDVPALDYIAMKRQGATA